MSAHLPLVSEMRKSGELPIKKIVEATGIVRKTIERHRQWLIVVTIVATSGYSLMAEWIGVQSPGGEL